MELSRIFEDSGIICQPECIQNELIRNVTTKRLESQKIQKGMYSQLEMIQKKGNTLDAVTLRPGTQYKGPTPPVQSTEPPTQDHRTFERTESNEALGSTKEKDTSETVRKKACHLPYPSATKRTKKVRVIDERIDNILKKVEVTLPLFEIIK
ncbi:hypothetical protein PIB30_028651 [Stylosanthes scabra]|uniref:Uncharacterized protein n=1 Tax=Stylosanthes scabra TaxID=79078 RepID=A0ABU6QAH8_9FABA|nr:hypothetical protein [Stylosanthes scabra]